MYLPSLSPVWRFLFTSASAASLAPTGPVHAPAPPDVVTIHLSEWKVELVPATIHAGKVRFLVASLGSIPHAFELEGTGIEKATGLIQPGASDSLTLALKPGNYEVYCPVGADSHKKLGMTTHLQVAGAKSAMGAGDESAAGAHCRLAPNA